MSQRNQLLLMKMPLKLIPKKGVIAGIPPQLDKDMKLEVRGKVEK